MAAPAQARVSFIDDDLSVRESLPDLLRQFGLDVRTFSSAAAFLDSGAVAETDCLILDYAMPGMSGEGLMLHLIGRGYKIPTVFITAHADYALRQRLLDEGATECLFKPLCPQALQQALQRILPGL